MVEDQFPIEMRVLIVEQDLTCLKNLEILLQECQHHVTTAQSGITALNLLRENKNNFDMLMTNVQIPGMDGFKLLELVGKALPVILFSWNDDPRMVMRGVLQGACDYIVTPFRMEKLQVIWQHVIRKNMKIRRSYCDEFSSTVLIANSNQNENASEKRKNHTEDNDIKNVDATARKKKPRVDWSNDLHHKFVEAVNQLGIDKAVPRKILRLMNVENLTTQNVASHLQKYRLYMKRVNMVTAIGRSSDTSYSRTSSLSEVGDYLHTLNSSREINRYNKPLMLESNPQDKSLVSQQSLFSFPSLAHSNLQTSYAMQFL